MIDFLKFSLRLQVWASRPVGTGIHGGCKPRCQRRQKLHVTHAKCHERQHALHEGTPVCCRDNCKPPIFVSPNIIYRLTMVQACLRAGSDMDAVNNDGNTAAHLAFKFNHSDLGECVNPSLVSRHELALPWNNLMLLCRYLLSKGASDSIENKDGLVCRALARSQPQA